MSAPMYSGIYYSVNDQRRILITQGLEGYTLVTKKKILFRLYLDLSHISQVTLVLVTVSYRLPDSNFNVKKYFTIPRDHLFVEKLSPNGPSIGIIFEGKVFDSSFLIHNVEFSVMVGDRVVLRSITPDLKFLPSGRLRILIHALVGTTPWGNKIEQNFAWLIEMFQSLERIAAMLPVRDGLNFGLNHPTTGLCYIFGSAIDTWPQICPSGNPPTIPDERFPNVLRCSPDDMIKFLLEEARQLNSGGTEQVNVTVGWRPRDTLKFPPPGGESCGGQGFPGSSGNNRLATVVGGNLNGMEMTAPIMAQEVGHTFGLEPGTSPHTDGSLHSKDPLLIDPLAFDFYHLRPYFPLQGGATFLGDVMSYAWSQGRDATLYNAYDWEYLRQRLVQLPGISPEIVDETDTEKLQKRVVEDLQIVFADLQKIEVENIESTLSSKPGFEWYWTPMGFQQLMEGKLERTGYGLNPSVEMIISALRELDIKEFYAPVEGKPLTIITSTTQKPSVTCYNNGIRSSGLP